MVEMPNFIQNVNMLKPCVYSYAKEMPSEKGSKVMRFYKEDRLCFKEPAKIYGDYAIKANHIFSYFYNRGISVAAMLVGEGGSGKTLTSELICNIAIRHGLPVIYVSGIRLDADDCKFLSQLDNCVILIDEFGKIVSRDIQELMLSMLTDKSKSILYLLTENVEGYINRFFLSRPGRVRYYLKYGKLPFDVLTEYLQDHKVADDFKHDLISGYKEAEVFTFDHLESLVQEHYFNPNMTLKDMIEIMNVKNLETNYFIRLVKIEYLGHEIPLIRMPKRNPEEQQDQSLSLRREPRDIGANNLIGKVNLNLTGTKYVAVDNSRSYTDETYKLTSGLETMYLPFDTNMSTSVNSFGGRRGGSYGISQSCFRYIIDNPDIMTVDCKPAGLSGPCVLEDTDIYLLSESELEERLKEDPFSLADASNKLESLRTAYKNKPAKEFKFKGVPGGGKIEGLGKTILFTNGYINLHFGIADETSELVFV